MSSPSPLEQKTDQALFTVAQRCQDGIPEILSHFFGFLARRTDYFSSKDENECREEVMKAYGRQCENLDKAMRQKRLLRDQEEMRERKLLRQKLAMEKAKKEEEAKKKVEEETNEEHRDDKVPEKIAKVEMGLMPNEGNGCDLEHYKWTQTLDSIEITIPFKTDFALKSRDVVIEFQKMHLKVGLRGWEPTINGNLADEILVNDDTTWMLDDRKNVTIQLSKKTKGRFWSRLVITDPKINIKN